MGFWWACFSIAGRLVVAGGFAMSRFGKAGGFGKKGGFGKEGRFARSLLFIGVFFSRHVCGCFNLYMIF